MIENNYQRADLPEANLGAACHYNNQFMQKECLILSAEETAQEMMEEKHAYRLLAVVT